MTQQDLNQFTGTENYYKSLVKGLVYTDGARYVAKEGGAYWLIDKIALSQFKPRVRVEDFQTWKFAVKDNSGVLTCDDGNGNIVFREKIDYTDFPLAEIKFFFCNGVLMLPSEY